MSTDKSIMCSSLFSLADEIHRVFGIIMSLQVCESSAVAVLLLLRLAPSPHLDLTNAFMTYTFVGSLFLLLASNLWIAGEVTYQASLLYSSLFYCGWHLCDMEKERHRDIRRLDLIGCAQAQKPLILKAFGIQDLSYETFVSINFPAGVEFQSKLKYHVPLYQDCLCGAVVTQDHMHISRMYSHHATEAAYRNSHYAVNSLLHLPLRHG